MKHELNLIEPAQKYSDEDSARELMESLLWPNLSGVVQGCFDGFA
jgi:hypothetical protein